MKKLLFCFLLCLNVFASSHCVINIQNGQILNSRDGFAKIYPASLTKMMTLYTAYGYLDKNTIHFFDEIKGFKNKHLERGAVIYHSLDENQTANVNVKDLILATAIYSSNSSSFMLAEEISGDVLNFVKVMNENADKMGMTNTNFKNPDGLFDSENYSTACDMAKLIGRLYLDFPKRRYIFGTTKYFKDGVVYEKKTTIEQFMSGIEIAKTGYIKESGYNLATIFDKHDSQLAIVVIGEGSYTDAERKTGTLLHSLLRKEYINNEGEDANYLETKNKILNTINKLLF